MSQPHRMSARDTDPVAVSKAVFQAYVDKDRAAIEPLIAPDFHFTSPLDNHIDRTTYFERCWPNSATTAGFDFIRTVRDGDRVVVTYEGRTFAGKRFRNTEVHTVRGGQLTYVEVYFGWSLPHPAPDGGFMDEAPS